MTSIVRFETRVAQEHEERLTGYQALLARIESAAAEAKIAADEVTTGTASPFTDDIRYVIGLTEELLMRFRHRDDADATKRRENAYHTMSVSELRTCSPFPTGEGGRGVRAAHHPHRSSARFRAGAEGRVRQYDVRHDCAPL